MTGLVDPDSKPRRWPHGRFRAAKPLRMYLRPGDNFGMVMPNAVPSRRQYHGFRAGRFAVEGQPFPIEFGTPWDLERIRPIVFPQSSCVLFATRTDEGARMLGPESAGWASCRKPTCPGRRPLSTSTTSTRTGPRHTRTLG
jgi:hypothetical protein